MPSCECCWSASRFRSLYEDDAYSKTLDEHRERGCACSKPTLEGVRLRAGQFWRDGKDSRYSDEEWFALLDTLEGPA